MKKKIDFIEGESMQLCTVSKGTLVGEGVAILVENAKSSRLTGQTIAYYKAERDLCRQTRQIIKKEIADLEKMGVFLFPKKLACKETGFVKERFDKYLSQRKQKLKEIEKKIEYWDKTLEKYIENKKKTRAMIESRFGRKDEGRKLESKGV